jgi:hypothetical protein
VHHFFCILCSRQPVSGFLLNLLLFIPLGVVLGWSGRGIGRSTLLGACISVVIETAQWFIPGRESALSDIVANSAGALLGALLWEAGSGLLDPSPERRVRLGRGWVALAVLAQVLMAVLLPAALPHDEYFAQWNWNCLGLEPYPGAVRDARIGDVFLPSRVLRTSPRVRDLLLRGEHLDIAATAGPRPDGETTLFCISNGHHDYILMMLIDRDDIVLLPRHMTDVLGLAPLELRIPGAMNRVPPGGAIAVSAWRERGRWCVSLGEERSCERISAGSLWRIVSPGRAAANPLLDVIWMAFLFFPLGYYAVSGAGLVVAVSPMALLGLGPTGIVFSLLPIAGALSGVVAGRLVRVARTRRSLREGTRPA